MDGLGARVAYKGHLGTVRYRGPLRHTPAHGRVAPDEAWLGVEWDAPGRGQHDGTVEGVFYFAARGGARNGSLVRERLVEHGAGFMEAWARKYLSSAELEQMAATGEEIGDRLFRLAEEVQPPQAAVDVQQSADAVVAAGRGFKPIQFLGFARIWQRVRDLRSLTALSLAGTGVGELGRPGALRFLFPQLRELSLERNLLSRWSQVGRLAAELPRLQTLCLSFGRLSLDAPPQGAFAHLKHLSLKGVGLRWREFTAVRRLFPAVEELVLAENPLTDWEDLRLDAEDLPRLHRLDLARIGLSDVARLLALAPLRLTDLSLEGNAVESLAANDVVARLEQLNVTGNALGETSIWAQLSQLGEVRTLRCLQNPFLALLDKKHARCLIVACCPRLRSLNGGEVTRAERRDSEIYSLNSAFHEFFRLHGATARDYDPAALRRWAAGRYPRLQALIGAYGDPHPLEERLRPTLPGAGDAATRFVWLVLRRAADGATLRKRLPKAAQVGQLATLLKAAYGLRGRGALALEGPGGPLADPLRRLEDCGVGEGAVISWREA